MSQSLRQIKNRIRSIQNTEKLTRAMEMISISKLRSLQRNLLNSEEYCLKLEDILRHLTAAFPSARHPLLEERENKQKITLCLITSDTGLCGSYNYNLLRKAQDFIRQNQGREISLVTVGRKGFNYFKKEGLKISDAYIDLHGKYSSAAADKIAANLMDLFLSGKSGEVCMLYEYFETAARHDPVVEKILNVKSPGAEPVEYLTEPGAEDILGELVPLYIYSKVHLTMLSAFEAEHTSRVVAMKEATDNAHDLLEDLTLLRNKVRQANITREIIEVISSADAMKG
jgi:F-type H+-transporting ATPase subunit gamma